MKTIIDRSEADIFLVSPVELFVQYLPRLLHAQSSKKQSYVKVSLLTARRTDRVDTH